MLNLISHLINVSHHDTFLSELSLATVQFDIEYAKFTQNDYNVKIKPVTDDY